MRGTRRHLHGGRVAEESPNVSSAKGTGSILVKTPQHAATGKEVQAPLTGQNTDDYDAARKD